MKGLPYDDYDDYDDVVILAALCWPDMRPDIRSGGLRGKHAR
jgi:hypothetical protein